MFAWTRARKLQVMWKIHDKSSTQTTKCKKEMLGFLMQSSGWASIRWKMVVRWDQRKQPRRLPQNTCTTTLTSYWGLTGVWLTMKNRTSYSNLWHLKCSCQTRPTNAKGSNLLHNPEIKACSGWSGDIHHASRAPRWKRKHITIALGDLNKEHKVQLTGRGVPMTPYIPFHTPEALDSGDEFHTCRYQNKSGGEILIW